MKDATFKKLSNDKGKVQAGIEYAVTPDYVYMRFDRKATPELSKSKKSYIIAYTGGGSIPELGDNGGYFRGGVGLQLSDREKKQNELLRKQEELDALKAELAID
jgi:hypothetical protein